MKGEVSIYEQHLFLSLVRFAAGSFGAQNLQSDIAAYYLAPQNDKIVNEAIFLKMRPYCCSVKQT